MNPDNGERELLSGAGATRRREILADALRAADRRRRGRAVRRAGITACAAALFAGVFFVATRGGGEQPPPSPVVIEQPRPPETRTAPVRKEVRDLPSIKPPPRTPDTRPAVVAQIITNEDVTPRWEILNDDQLLAELASAGRPSGLARLNGKVSIVALDP